METDYTIYAVKNIQPWQEGADYWIPQLYEDVRAGRARFGWGYEDRFDLLKVQGQIAETGRQNLDANLTDVWARTCFLLDVRVDDYFVYINLPEWGKVSIVQITGVYSLGPVWDRDKKGDFRHLLPCRFIGSIDRRDPRVPPRLSRRMGLMGAWYRINARKEFEELLRALAEGLDGKTARERLRNDVETQLREVAAAMQRHFPGKKLEPLVREVLERLPGVVSVRNGPDTNGTDLEIVFESGLPISGLGRNELCAVQVKSYEGEMSYDRAIQDLCKAFDSSRPYSCGLIVSTALELTPEFEKKVEELREEKKKPIGVLFGQDLAQLLVGGRITNE